MLSNHFLRDIYNKDILYNTLYEVEDVDGKLEYILDESGDKVRICEIDDVDFNIVSLNNNKYFKFITGMAKYIVSYAENNPGYIPMLGSSLSNACIAHYIKAIQEDDIIKVPCVSFNKDNAKGSRAFYRNYHFVMDRHHVCILTTDLVSPIYLSLVLDNILVSQKYGWGSNVANADVVKLLDIKIPKEKQYNDKIYSSYMLQQSIAKNIEEKLENTHDKLKLVKTMKKLNKMKIDNTLDRIFINSLNESIFIDNCEIHINDINYDKTLTLEDIANKLNAGGTPPRNVVEYWDFLNTGENPWLDIDSKEFSTLKISNFRESITRDGINNSSTWKVPANSIMITIGGSLGFVANNNFDTYTNQNILSIVPKDEYYSRYLVYFLEYFYSTKVRNNSNGYSNLSKKTEEKRIVFIPKKLGSIESFDIQKAIADFLDKKYANYNHKKKQLDEINNILIGVKGKIWNF